MKPLLLDEFQNPGPRPRLAPFWFWNCGMDEAKVRRQVRQMAEAGCGGFFIHPRQGLTLPYLSKEWFARVRVAVEEAQKWGLEAWLYDEYPYPSGIAGGLVTANLPDVRARELRTFDFLVSGSEKLRREFPLGRIICAQAFPIEDGKVNWDESIDLGDYLGVVLTRELFWYWPMGHIPTNQKRFMADEGRLVLEWEAPVGEWQIFVGIEKEQRGFKYYDCFFDPLQPGAVEEFLRLTHDRYAAELGEFFGNTIPGIFTDETEPPAWSPEIEQELRQAYNLDLSRLLPALKREDHPQASVLRLQFRECALRLFQERWEAPIARWCQEHNLIWGAEKPTYRPAQFLNIAEPSTDAGHRRIPAPPEPLTGDLRANHRAAISAAEQSGGETVRCECFHSLGWGATLQDQKWSFDWLCAQGVNRFTPHAFYATSSGLQKHDAAPSFFAENPYWEHFSLLGDYIGRLSLAMSSGREKARVVLLHPTEVLWGGGEAARNAQTAFDTLQNELLARHIQFHIADAEALLQAESRAGGLELGRTRYEAVVTPVEAPSLEAALHKAREAGLTILKQESPDDWESYRSLKIRDAQGNEIPKLWALWRETDAQEIIFFTNTSGEAVAAHIELDVTADFWEEWSLVTGQSAPLNVQSDNTTTHLQLNLAPYGSALVVGSEQASAQVRAAQQQEKILTLPLDGQWNLTLQEPNALRLNRWQALSCNQDVSALDINDADWAEVEALPLRHLDRRGAGWKNLIERREGEAIWYRRRVPCEFVPDNLEILIEDGAILGDWTVFINGEEVPETAFAPREFWGEDKTAAFVARYFRHGDNMIALKVENAPEMGGLRTPLHLLGDFSLGGMAQRVLQTLPQKAPFHDCVTAGLPHFSGTISYSKSLELSGATHLELTVPFGDIAALRVGGQTLGVRAWSPYLWELTTELKNIEGEVEVEIAVTNTLLPFVEGQQWNPIAGAAFAV